MAATCQETGRGAYRSCPRRAAPSGGLQIASFSGPAIDVLYGYQQQVITGTVDGNLVIRDLLVNDYPVLLRLRSTKRIFLPSVLKGHLASRRGSAFPGGGWTQDASFARHRDEECNLRAALVAGGRLAVPAKLPEESTAYPQ